MPLPVLGIIVLVALLVVVIGAALLGLSDSLRSTREAERKRSAERAAKSPPPPTREEIRRYTPKRTGLRWYSPEIVALLLLALAAGLWIARLAG